MSTQNMADLSKTSPLGTCFITHKGRMVECAYVFEEGPEEFFLMTSAPDASTLHNWLQGFHFAEDLCFETNYWKPWAFIILPQGQKRAFHPLVQGGIATMNDGFSYEIVLVLHEGDTASYHPVNEQEWQTLRIMALMPDFPQEINQDFLPHNINLERFVAENKGCYIGQEVIAKALTYQKHKKSLRGVKLTLKEWREGQSGNTSLLGLTSRAPIYLEHEINALVVEELSQS